MYTQLYTEYSLATSTQPPPALRPEYTPRAPGVALSKKQVPFSMAIGNGELMHECFRKHSCMETTRMK